MWRKLGRRVAEALEPEVVMAEAIYVEEAKVEAVEVEESVVEAQEAVVDAGVRKK